ncbi:MAG: flagellar biosynthesis protein FlhF [Gammaproteobacteria bacterium]|jgi:flagellar biosynthesis protein FlhF
MKIKRTFAPTMREALSLVKQEQGPDAVILGNKKVPGGVEIISAIDYDESTVNGGYTNSTRSGISEERSAPSELNLATQASKLTLNRQTSNELASDTWVGSLVTDEQNGRREPILGPVAGIPKKKVVTPAKPPAWLEKAFERAERMPGSKQINPNLQQDFQSQSGGAPVGVRPTPIVNTKPAPTPAMQPVPAARSEKVVSANRVPPQPVNVQPEPLQPMPLQQGKPKQSNSRKTQLNTNVPPVQKTVKKASAREPMIDEVRTELKGLRDLMQSQLSVLQWDQFAKRHPVRTVLLNLMSDLGLGSDICEIIFSHLDELNHDPHKVWQQALGILAKCLPVNRTDILADGGRIALVGSTGVGKTTTIAKLAARFAHIHGKRSVAMISTDHFRIGAQEQLQHFARLLELPLLTANTSAELGDRLDMLADKKLVLIDTAGMSQHDIRLSERFHRLQNSAPQIKPYLVLSANTQLAALNQTIKCFSKVQLAGAIVTKLDEAASLGGVMTASIRHQLPLTYCGTGQRVPEDLETAKSHRIISKAVALMQAYSESEDQETLAVRFNNIVNQSANIDINKKLAEAGL